MRTLNRMSLLATAAALAVMPFAYAQSTGAADPKVNTQPNANQSAAAAGTNDPAPSDAAQGSMSSSDVDTNFDGSVSRDEAFATGMADADFDAGDIDSNGLMSASEYENARGKTKKM